MGLRKIYEPHCPARDCNGGRLDRLHGVLLSVEKEIPPEVLKRKAEGMQTWQCGYCGFVWFQERKHRPGFEAIPAGKWDSNQEPGEFSVVPLTYKIRGQNTRTYWDAYAEKLRRRRNGGRRRFGNG